MSVTIEALSTLAAGEPPDPYAQFPVKIADHRIEDPMQLARPLTDPAGVLLANGYLPNALSSGLVRIGNEYVAFDHVGLDGDRKKLLLRPTSKSSVGPDGRLLGEGVEVIHQPGGIFTIASVAIDASRHPWMAESLRNSRPHYSDEGIRVFSARTLMLPPYEIVDIDTFNLLVTALAIEYN